MMNSPAYVETDIKVVKESDPEKNASNTVEYDVTQIKNFRNQMINSFHVDATDKHLVMPHRLNTIQSGKEN